MTFKQVEYFLRVFACRNIAAAAEELFVSRPVISKAILTLEEEVGTPLFQRSKRRRSANRGRKSLISHIAGIRIRLYQCVGKNPLSKR